MESIMSAVNCQIRGMVGREGERAGYKGAAGAAIGFFGQIEHDPEKSDKIMRQNKGIGSASDST
jgi:hypothetical protein